MTQELVRNTEACVRPDLNQNLHFEEDLHDSYAHSGLRSPSLDEVCTSAQLSLQAP